MRKRGVGLFFDKKNEEADVQPGWDGDYSQVPLQFRLNNTNHVSSLKDYE